MKSADDVSLEERCQTHSLAQACVIFSQGIAFLHAGDELLRSKSLDRDGYNSGEALLYAQQWSSLPSQSVLVMHQRKEEL